MSEMNNRIIAVCLLGMILIDLSSVFWDEYYKRRDDEPVKYQLSNNFTSQTYTSLATGTASPSPSESLG